LLKRRVRKPGCKPKTTIRWGGSRFTLPQKTGRVFSRRHRRTHPRNVPKALIYPRLSRKAPAAPALWMRPLPSCGDGKIDGTRSAGARIANSAVAFLLLIVPLHRRLGFLLHAALAISWHYRRKTGPLMPSTQPPRRGHPPARSAFVAPRCRGRTGECRSDLALSCGR